MRRRRRVLILSVVFALLVVLYNGVVFLHARAMTHFTDGGPRTESPQKLSTTDKLEALLLGVRIPKFQSKTTPAHYGLEFSTHRFASSHGAELEAWRIPSASSRGVAIVFHGYAAGKAAQLGVAKELHDLGLETVLVDFRGSGGSSGFETTLGVLEADDVAASVAWVTSNVSSAKPIVFGTSMGSAAILRAARFHQLDARAAILECPFGRMLAAVESRFALMGVPSWPTASLLVFWGGGLDGFTHEPVEFARYLRCPTLLLHGDADPTVSVEQVREILANLPARKELVTFPGAVHEGYLSKHRAAWRAAVQRFVE